MVLIDSDVLLLAFAYPNDDRQKVNQKFLDAVQTAQPVTTIYNVMETLGQLSFNLSTEQLNLWQDWLANAHHRTIIWESEENITPENWKEIIYDRPFQKMLSVRMAFMNALILSLVERLPEVECFVSWNAKHFKGKTKVPVCTPKEYLAK